MTPKEKAERYDEALDRARKLKEDPTSVFYEYSPSEGDTVVDYIFPELKESEDERIRKSIIENIKGNMCRTGGDYDLLNKQIAWLEKQGDIDKSTYEIAEKEKCDFVSGQFIECRKSFDEFKEDNSYWFDYVGNDTYIGRSDNIFNKKFHITPKQLYRLFTQQHRPKENTVNEETNVLI